MKTLLLIGLVCIIGFVFLWLLKVHSVLEEVQAKEEDPEKRKTIGRLMSVISTIAFIIGIVFLAGGAF